MAWSIESLVVKFESQKDLNNGNVLIVLDHDIDNVTSTRLIKKMNDNYNETGTRMCVIVVRQVQVPDNNYKRFVESLGSRLMFKNINDDNYDKNYVLYLIATTTDLGAPICYGTSGVNCRLKATQINNYSHNAMNYIHRKNLLLKVEKLIDQTTTYIKSKTPEIINNSDSDDELYIKETIETIRYNEQPIRSNSAKVPEDHSAFRELFVSFVWILFMIFCFLIVITIFYSPTKTKYTQVPPGTTQVIHTTQSKSFMSTYRDYLIMDFIFGNRQTNTYNKPSSVPATQTKTVTK